MSVLVQCDAMTESLISLIHADPKTGKSWLAQTTPAPRLILDAESGGSRFARVWRDGRWVKPKSVNWDPHTEAPPEPGEWETCFVTVRDFDTLVRVFQYLNAGNHPFVSVALDSLTEIQKRCKDSIKSGDEVMNERQWGILLDRMEALVRGFRDLREHPTNPIPVLLILALTKEVGVKFKPAVQGALGISLPGYCDLVGYLGVAEESDERRLVIKPNPRFEAGDRTHVLSHHPGWEAYIPNPSITEMLTVLNNEES